MRSRSSCVLSSCQRCTIAPSAPACSIRRTFEGRVEGEGAETGGRGGEDSGAADKETLDDAERDGGRLIMNVR